MEEHRPDVPAHRVLLLAESPYFGGITSHLVTLAAGLRAGGSVSPLLATLPGRSADRTLFDRAACCGMDVIEVPMRGRFDPVVVRRLRGIARELRTDFVHTHNYRATLLAAAALPHLPLVVTCHGLLGPGAPLGPRCWQALELRCMRLARAVIACSGPVRADLLARGLDAERVHVVHNGVAGPSALDCDRAALRSTLGIHRDGPVVLFAGRIVPGKGVEVLLEACAQRRDWHCVIVGDGPGRAGMEALAQRCNVDALFAGMQREMTPWYLAADVVALPSRSEAFPMVLLEAAAHGRPVIAAAVGGVPEIVLHRRTGLLLPESAGDSNPVRDMAAALALLRDPETRDDMGRNARIRWEESFTPGRMAERTVSVYHTAWG